MEDPPRLAEKVGHHWRSHGDADRHLLAHVHHRLAEVLQTVSTKLLPVRLLLRLSVGDETELVLAPEAPRMRAQEL